MDRKSLTLIAGLIMATASGSGIALAGPEALSNDIAYQTLSADQMSHIVGTQAVPNPNDINEASSGVLGTAFAQGNNASFTAIRGDVSARDNGTHTSTAYLEVVAAAR